MYTVSSKMVDVTLARVITFVILQQIFAENLCAEQASIPEPKLS